MATTPVLIILAGGASSRMWPLRGKLMLRFGTEPLLLSQVRRFQALGFQEAIIVASPDNADEITLLVAGIAPMNIRVVVQHEPRGMGDALLQASTALPAADLPIYVTQIHDVVDDRLHLDMLAAFNTDPTATYIAGYEREDYFPGGYLIVDTAGRITGMVEKPGAANRPSNLVNIVDHIHPNAARLMQAIAAEYARTDVTSDDHYERAMDALMKQTYYRVVPYRGAWMALKYPWHVLDVMNYYLGQIQGQHIAESAYVAKTASIVGDVYIGERVKIFPGAAVVGPAYIGSDTIVGNNALVRASMVLSHCNVGFTTEVARSYVSDHCDMHACRVLDSVFAPHVNFSAGCTTANLRMDRGKVSSYIKGQRIDTGRDKLGAVVGQGAFLSVDVMTMPGVKVGEGAQVGPGTHVHRDIRDRQRVYVRQEVVVVDSGEERA
jgi:NDP-sugar pyrophosphorylase family protein